MAADVNCGWKGKPFTLSVFPEVTGSGKRMDFDADPGITDFDRFLTALGTVKTTRKALYLRWNIEVLDVNFTRRLGEIDQQCSSIKKQIMADFTEDDKVVQELRGNFESRRYTVVFIWGTLNCFIFLTWKERINQGRTTLHLFLIASILLFFFCKRPTTGFLRRGVGWVILFDFVGGGVGDFVWAIICLSF